MSEEPTRRGLLKGRALRGLPLQAGVTLAVLALVGIGGYVYQRLSEEREQREAEALRVKAVELAGRLGESLAAPIKKLEAIAGDPGLVQLFQSGDRTAIAARAEALGSGIESELKLRLILPGTTQYADEAVPPLGYASLDLLRRAETDNTTPRAELHLFGSQHPYVAVVRRVADPDSKLVGLLHLSLDPSILSSAIGGLDLEGAYIEVHQVSSRGSPLVVAKSSEQRALNEAPHGEAPIPASEWTLFYWPAGSLAKGATTGYVWAGAIGVLILVLPGIALLIWRRRRARLPAVAEDAVIYQGAVKSIMDGAYPGLEHLIPDLPRSTPPSIEPILLGDTIPLDEVGPAAADDQDEAMAQPIESQPEPLAVSDSIFRAYDIRGVVGDTLNEEAVYRIGLALGSEAYARGQQDIVVARDGRSSGPALAQALERGLRESGRNVIDIGMVPTPVLYFATHYLDTHSGVMLTGSHNPANYNGLKIVLDGKALSGEAITAIRDRIARGEYTRGAGELRSAEIGAEYIRRITEDIPVALGRDFKVVIDCGNGVPGILAPSLMRALGHDVIELFCEVDGSFPNHHPDPSQPENLADLIRTVKREKADLGLAFDGDGDRLGVVDGQGQIIWPDRQMMLFAKDVLSRNPGGEIIFDVKCSRHLRDVIVESGGKPLMWKTGHSLIKAKMRESDAPLAGEMSGHIFFKERWYGFDDALYAAARLLEILVKDKRPPSAVFAALPGGLATPELRLAMPEGQHAQFMSRLKEKAAFRGAEVSTVDGLRVDFPDSWGLIRPSNTTPYLILRFEADDREALGRIQGAFRQLLTGLDPALQLPF